MTLGVWARYQKSKGSKQLHGLAFLDDRGGTEARHSGLSMNVTEEIG